MRLETLTLTSKDLARSRAFYTAKLGFQLVEERDGMSFVIDAGSIKLHVDKAGPRAPLAEAEPRLVFLTEQLMQRCMVLRDQGISVDGPHKAPGGVMAELRDPDGHPITLWERN